MDARARLLAASLVLIAFLVAAASSLQIGSTGQTTTTTTLSPSSSSPPPATAGGEWTLFIRDYNDSRYNPDSTINSSNVGHITQKWFLQTGYSVTSTPVVQGGKVYFADWGGNVYSANLADGTIVWKVNLGLPISSTLALADGRVFVGLSPYGPSPKVYALDQQTGRTLWVSSINTTIPSIWASPTVYNGLVYIGVAAFDIHNASEYGGVVALNESSGSLVWSFQTAVQSPGAPVWSTVVVDPTLNSIYFGTGDSFNSKSNTSTSILYSYCIMSLDASSGKMNWYYQAWDNRVAGDDWDFGSTPNLFTLSVHSQLHKAIGIGGKDGVYYVVDRTNGALLAKENVSSPPGIIGAAGFVYPSGDQGNPEVFIPATNGLIALSPANNTVDWRHAGPKSDSSVAVVPGAVLYGDNAGHLFALSTSDGSVLFSTTIPVGVGSGVTVAEGAVLVGSYQVSCCNVTTGSQFGVYAFSLPSSAASSSSSSASSSTK